MASRDGIPQFASLYVGDLKPEVTEAMLYEIFNAVGPVASIRVCRDSITRKSLGYGYVNFHNVADAERGIDTLNYSSIKGRSCRIMWSQRDPSLRKSGAGNIYVKNLDKNIDNKALYDTFSLFGTILSCKVAADLNGNSFGYGFVQYETAESAEQAITRVNGMTIGERVVTVCEFEKHKHAATEKIYTNLYVKNFPAEWTESKLHEVFSEAGAVDQCALREDPKGRPFAFVSFKTPEDAKNAVETLHQRDLRTEEERKADEEANKEPELDKDGHAVHTLYVGRAQTKQERQKELKNRYANDGSNSNAGVNLYVKNLDETTSDESLRALFEPFGSLTSAHAPQTPEGKSKGFGFVCFSSADDATKAVTEMHLKVMSGKPLYVGLAEKAEERQQRLKEKYNPRKGDGKGKVGAKGVGKGFNKGFNKGGGGGGNQNYGGYGGGGGGFPAPNMFGNQPMMPMGMGNNRPPMGGGMMGGGMMGGGMIGGPMGGPMGSPMGGGMMGGPPMMAMGGKGSFPPSGPMSHIMGKGGMPGGMPPMGMNPMPGPPQQTRPQMPMQGNRGRPPPAPNTPLNASVLAAAPPAVQKQMIGEKMFVEVSKIQPDLAGKITGMMLEMDNSELLMLLESEHQLRRKVQEAIRVLC